MATVPTNWTPNHAPTAAEAGELITIAQGMGWATSLDDATSANSDAAGTETVGSSIQFLPIFGARYRVHFDGPTQSTVIGDTLDVFLRWSHTSSVGVAGTQIGRSVAEVVLATGRPVRNIIFTRSLLAVSSNLITVVCSFKRRTGTGTVKMDGTSGYSLHWEVECVAMP